MVSLEGRASYLQKVSENAKLKAFQNFIFGMPAESSLSDLKEIDEIYFGIITSISKRDKSSFGKLYTQLSKRKIDNESAAPFIHDDALIFSLILGVIKFNYDKEWIEQIVEVRGAHDVSNTFKSLLKGDYTSKVNLPQVVIPFLELLGSNVPSDDFINEAYKSISNNLELFDNKSDFIILLSLRTYDSIILSKSTEEGAFNRLKKFESIFLKRTKWIAWIIYNLLLLMIIYGTWRAISLLPAVKENVNDIGTIIGILGIQIIGNFVSAMRNTVEKKLRSFFGYKY